MIEITNEALIEKTKIVPIAEETIESFHQCLDAVARERRYLAFVQAPPLESAREFVMSNIAHNIPQFVAVRGEEVIGWCDISPMRLEGFRHCGRLGMGVHPDFRGRGLGQRLIDRTIAEAKQRGLERIEPFFNGPWFLGPFVILKTIVDIVLQLQFLFGRGKRVFIAK